MVIYDENIVVRNAIFMGKSTQYQRLSVYKYEWPLRPTPSADESLPHASTQSSDLKIVLNHETPRHGHPASTSVSTHIIYVNYFQIACIWKKEQNE